MIFLLSFLPWLIFCVFFFCYQRQNLSISTSYSWDSLHISILYSWEIEFDGLLTSISVGKRVLTRHLIGHGPSLDWVHPWFNQLWSRVESHGTERGHLRSRSRNLGKCLNRTFRKGPWGWQIPRLSSPLAHLQTSPAPTYDAISLSNVTFHRLPSALITGLAFLIRGE